MLLPIVIVIILAILAKGCNAVDYDNQGFDLVRSFSGNGEHYSLSLIAAGIRRKKVVFINVDVYKVGIYVSEDLDKRVQSVSITSSTETCSHLANPLTEGIEATSPTLAIVLRFVRDVDGEKVVTAMQEALLSPTAPKSDASYVTAVNEFMDILKKSFGSAGFKQSEELVFTYASPAVLEVFKNQDLVGKVSNQALRSSLLDVYVGDNAVAPEIPVILTKRYQGQKS